MRHVCLGLGVWWLLMAPASAAGAGQLARLERLHRELILDQPLDAAKLERLQRAAREDDLVFDRDEVALLGRLVQRGYQDPGGEPPPTLEPTFSEPLIGMARRVQQLLVRALHAPLGSGRVEAAFRELAGLALAPEFSPAAREQALTLLDQYRELDPRRVSRGASEALALLFSDPAGAREDRAHRRELAVLERLINLPPGAWGPATASLAPARSTPALGAP